MKKRLTGIQFLPNGTITPTEHGLQMVFNGQTLDLTEEEASQMISGLKNFMTHKDGLGDTEAYPFFLFPLNGIDDVRELMEALESADLMPSGLVPAAVSIDPENSILFTALPPLKQGVDVQ
ncbi:MAG: hypothetical protein ACRCXB_04505 [Aeromonadaceae bacterium]